MFCGKCGNKINDGSTFCPECGEKLNEVTYNNNNSVSYTSGKNIKRKIISIVVAVAVVFGVVGIFRAIFSDSAEDVAIKYAEATERLDLEECCKYLAMDYEKFMDDYINAITEAEDMTIDEFYDELEEELENDLDEKIRINDISDVIKYVSEEAGKKFEERDIDISCRITDTEEIDETDIRRYLKDVQNVLDDFDGTDGFILSDYIDKDKIRKAYKFSYKLKMESDEDSYSDKGEIIVAKYGWSWKIIGFPEDFDF